MLNRTTTSGVSNDAVSSGSREASAGPPNALTVDVEDYFHVEALSAVIDRSDWDNLPGRIQGNMERLLALLADHGAHGTFFILGWVAQRHPQLVRAISDAGHEVASHGWAHHRVDQQDPEEFRSDCAKTKHLMEDLSGEAVIGYRAATFSINHRTPWAHEILKEVGYEYSSSIHPIRHDLYGMPDAPRHPFRPAGDAGVVELPISTLALAGRRIPCGGGGFFRLFPYAFSRWAIGHINRHEGRPCIFYLHPWEIDPAQPRQRGLALKSRFRHYLNLHRMEGRLARLLDHFVWKRMDDVFRLQISGSDLEQDEIAFDRS